MTDNLKRAKETLNAKNFTCVVVDKQGMRTSTLSGIKPLMQWLAEDKKAFEQASIADRCIGKAAAMLMVYGGVKEVYTNLISEHAIQLFADFAVPVEYKERVEYIINRDKTGMCPMEEACLEINNLEEAYQALQNKLKTIGQK